MESSARRMAPEESLRFAPHFGWTGAIKWLGTGRRGHEVSGPGEGVSKKRPRSPAARGCCWWPGASRRIGYHLLSLAAVQGGLVRHGWDVEVLTTEPALQARILRPRPRPAHPARGGGAPVRIPDTSSQRVARPPLDKLRRAEAARVATGVRPVPPCSPRPKRAPPACARCCAISTNAFIPSRSRPHLWD